MINIKKILLVLIALLLTATPAFASVTVNSPDTQDKWENDKVDLCHQTESETNPWVSISVDQSAVQTHLDNGDFIIDEGHPCPPEDQIDVCPNIDGDQTALPEGYHFNADKECVKDETPVATPSAPVATPSAPKTQLPDTGSDALLVGFISLAVAGLAGGVKFLVRKG